MGQKRGKSEAGGHIPRHPVYMVDRCGVDKAKTELRGPGDGEAARRWKRGKFSQITDYIVIAGKVLINPICIYV